MDNKGTLRYECDSTGRCYYKDCLPKFDILNKALQPPYTERASNIKFSDGDGLVERNGYFLLLEWKFTRNTTLPIGQEILLKAFSEMRHSYFDERYNSVFVVYGDPQTMEIYSFTIICNGVSESYDKEGDWNLQWRLLNKIGDWMNLVNRVTSHW